MNWYKKANNELFEQVTLLAQQLSNEFGANVDLYLTKNQDLKLDSIIVPKDKRQQGIGSRIVQRITDFADGNGLRTILTTGIRDPHVGTTSQSRLKKFYRQFGFLNNKGRNKDFTITEDMFRPNAQTINQENIDSNELV
jgi:predicted GNAT family N-acyltransferase